MNIFQATAGRNLCVNCVAAFGLAVSAGIAAPSFNPTDPQALHAGSARIAVPAYQNETPQNPIDARERTVTTAVLLLLGIAGIGLMLIALVMMWGRRMRRIARSPLPHRSTIDPLWYLRPGRNATNQPAGGNSSNAAATDRPDRGAQPGEAGGGHDTRENENENNSL